MHLHRGPIRFCRPHDSTFYLLELAGLIPRQLAAPRSSIIISKYTRLFHSVPAIPRPLFHSFLSFRPIGSSARVVFINARRVRAFDRGRASGAVESGPPPPAASGGLAGPRAGYDWRPAADGQAGKNSGPGPELDDLTVRLEGATRW